MADFINIAEGWHELSGFCDSTVRDSYNDEDVNALIICIDGKNYLCYEDPDDGYRSHSEFKETEQECTNTFPPQRVMIKKYDEENNYDKNHGIKIYSPDFELILHVGTQNYDDWYPMAVWEWHPENLPINNGVHKPEYTMPGELTMKVKGFIFDDTKSPTDILDVVDQYYKKAHEAGKMEVVKRIEECLGEFDKLSKYVSAIEDITEIVRKLDPEFKQKEN